MSAQKDILEWYQLAGVTEAIGEEPVCRLQSETKATPQKAAINPLDNLVNDARKDAQTAADLKQLRQLLDSFDGCALKSVHSKGDQPWVFFGRNDAKAETPVLWPPHAKS